MAYYLYTVLCVALFAVSINNCSALSEEKKAEIKEKLKAHVAECGPQYGITTEILKEFKAQDKQPDDSNKCFFACMFKKIGLMDSKGMYSEDVAIQKLSQYADESKLEDAKAAAKACSSEEEHKEMHQIMMPLITECSEQHGTKPDDIIAVESKDVDGMDSCLIDCVFKKLGVANTIEQQKFNEYLLSLAAKCGMPYLRDINVAFPPCTVKCCLRKLNIALSTIQKTLVQAQFLSKGLICVKTNPLTLDDINTFKMLQMPDVFANDESSLSKVENIVQECSKVNDEQVEDGDKGCDRAALAFACLTQVGPKAESLEEYKVKYVNNILECSKEFPITSEDILTLRKKELPEGDNVKCLLACINDENITGDKKDCDRAAMIFKCSVERAAEFDFTT
ncbi:hypothetical protein MSG28_004623 [Choristoneura fumiferana]|uniref:Uncharacterized protein n=1 Tax=Choristoneura fumiferana TaxID=7141 RepID=A0ACC0K7Y7_CHOFU|nr:hypothetical protein MSG28_004623 [Choristoneura fumiferana]